jgi:hypothetical protein
MPHVFSRFPRACVASIVVTAAAALMGGCASPNDAGSPTTSPSAATASPVSASARQSGKHAECLVCKENADLACVDLTVDRDTPHADYNGKTYYFCSDECKRDFQKHPEKYAK